MNIEKIYKKGLEQWGLALKGGHHLFEDMNNPKVGNLVFESTTGRLHGHNHIGFLIAVDYNSGWPQYWILNCKEKKVIKWENCQFIKIPGHYLCEYDEFKKIEKETKR